MKKGLLISVLLLSATSYADDTGFYLGAGVGGFFTSSGDYYSGAATGISGQAYVGYNFMRYFGTELDVNSGAAINWISIAASTIGSSIGYTSLSGVSVTDYGLSVIGYLPVFPTSNFKLFTKLGLSLNTQQLSVSQTFPGNNQTQNFNVYGTNIGFLYGLGMQYDLWNKVILRLAYQNNGNSNPGDGYGSFSPNFVNLSLGYKF